LLDYFFFLAAFLAFLAAFLAGFFAIAFNVLVKNMLNVFERYNKNFICKNFCKKIFKSVKPLRKKIALINS